MKMQSSPRELYISQIVSSSIILFCRYFIMSVIRMNHLSLLFFLITVCPHLQSSVCFFYLLGSKLKPRWKRDTYQSFHKMLELKYYIFGSLLCPAAKIHTGWKKNTTYDTKKTTSVSCNFNLSFPLKLVNKEQHTVWIFHHLCIYHS